MAYDIPDDVMLHMISFLTPEWRGNSEKSLAALAALNVTNRRMRRLTMKPLYTHCTWQDGYHMEYISPEAAKHIKTLTINTTKAVDKDGSLQDHAAVRAKFPSARIAHCRWNKNSPGSLHYDVPELHLQLPAVYSSVGLGACSLSPVPRGFHTTHVYYTKALPAQVVPLTVANALGAQRWSLVFMRPMETVSMSGFGALLEGYLKLKAKAGSRRRMAMEFHWTYAGDESLASIFQSLKKDLDDIADRWQDWKDSPEGYWNIVYEMRLSHPRHQRAYSYYPKGEEEGIPNDHALFDALMRHDWLENEFCEINWKMTNMAGDIICEHDACDSPEIIDDY